MKLIWENQSVDKLFEKLKSRPRFKVIKTKGFRTLREIPDLFTLVKPTKMTANTIEFKILEAVYELRPRSKKEFNPAIWLTEKNVGKYIIRWRHGNLEEVFPSLVSPIRKITTITAMGF